jgi:hypothetical protein
VPKRGSHSLPNGSRSAAVAGRPRRASASARSLDEAGSALASRLRGRLPEIQAAVATRVYAISDPHDVADPAYLQGLEAALAAAIEQRLAVLEVGERRAPAVPPVLLAQARLDARDGVSLDTVLRRYFAGSSLFDDFLVEEAERAEVPSSALRRLLAAQATLGDRLLAAVSAEHAREAKSWPSSTAERRRECVKRLLAGELVDHSELGYDLDAHHLALMARGEGAPEAMRELAGRLDRRLLAVCREEEATWACWLGGRSPLEAEQALRALGEISLGRVFVTVGEPGEGLSGWRFSHRQAKVVRPRRRCRSPSAEGSPSSATPTSPCWPRSSATISSPIRCGSSTWSRSQGRGMAAGRRGRPCAPTSAPSATSPRPLPGWGSIAARSRTAFVPSRTSTAVPSRTSRRSWRPLCDWTIPKLLNSG